MDEKFKWTCSGDTDIRKTLIKHWPKESQDAVWERIKRQIDNEERPLERVAIKRVH